jgi:hypothetical protein
LRLLLLLLAYCCVLLISRRNPGEIQYRSQDHRLYISRLFVIHLEM